MENKIKILYIIHSLNIGGSEKIAVDCANGLNPNKYSVSFISLSLYNPEKSIFNVIPLNQGIEVFYFNFEFDSDFSLTGYMKYIIRKKESFKQFQSINDLVTKLNPKLIHFHANPRELMLRNFFDLKVPAIYTDQLMRLDKNGLGLVKSNLLAFIFRRFYRNFHVVAVSKEIKKSLYKNRVVSKRKPIHLILNAVNIDFFQTPENASKPEGLVAAYVARIEEIKGHEVLVKAWASLHDISDKKLYIVGADGLKGKIQQLAQELDCAKSIEFTGAIYDPRTLLQNVNLGIFPSYQEGLPVSLLEKMAMSLPVIVSDIPELTAVVTHSKNGLIFKAGDSADLAKKIRELYNTPKLAESLGKEARATVVSDYNFSESLLKLESLYYKILN